MTWDPLSFDSQFAMQTEDLGGPVLASIGRCVTLGRALLLPANGESGDYSMCMAACDFSAQPRIGSVVRVNGLLSGKVIQKTPEIGFLVLRVADFTDE